jgi:hypothetical protein
MAFHERHTTESTDILAPDWPVPVVVVSATCRDCGEAFYAPVSHVTSLRLERALARVGPDPAAQQDALQAIADDLLIGTQVH